MNALYLVWTYSREANAWARYLLTVPERPAAEFDAESADALKQCGDTLAPSWRIRHATRICSTPDEVWKEF